MRSNKVPTNEGHNDTNWRGGGGCITQVLGRGGGTENGYMWRNSVNEELFALSG